VLSALVAATLLAPAWSPGLTAANAYADGRPGTVAFAVRTDKDVWGRGLDRPLQSASVVKALLLVAYLRRPGVRERALTRDERQILTPMIRWSNNHDASEVVTRLGAARINRAAHRAGMRRFHLDAIWGRSLITAREQSRFFLHIDARLPPRHRAYAMELLRTVVHTQRWGLGEVIPRGWTAYFKGGWGSGRGLVDHQVALLTRGKERMSVAVLTTTTGGHAAGKETLRGVFRRLLRGLARSKPRTATAAG
jgi:beta-lactamase class A